MTEVSSSAYPANSHKARNGNTETTERKKIDKVINGDAVKRKKGLGRKMAETFTGDDVHSVGTYILFDVIMPAAKTMVSDAVSQGIERMLFGDGARRTSSKSGVGHTSYNRMYNAGASRDNRSSDRPTASRTRVDHEFDEVILETRGEAEEVMDLLMDLIQNYDVVTVSDLYDSVGISGSYTNDKWGWTNLKGAGIRRVRAGYLIDLPRPVALD